MNWILLAKIMFTIWAVFDFVYRLKKDNEIQTGFFLLIWLIANRAFF